MKLYEINAEINNLIDYETGEILDLNKLNELQIEKENKIENVLFVIKNTKAEADSIAEEIKRLQAMKKTRDNIVKSLRTYLAYNIEDKYKSEHFSVTVKCLDDFKIEDESKIPTEFKTYKMVEEIDTAKIKAELKAGKEIPGAFLGSKKSVTIR